MAQTESIEVRVSETGSRTVSRNLEQIGESAKTSASGVQTLQKAVGAVAAAFAVDKIIRWTDAWNGVTASLRTVTGSMQTATNVQKELYKIAQDSNSTIEQNANAYQQLSSATAGVGASQKDLLVVVKSISQAMTVQGADAGAAAGAVSQFALSLTRGEVGGRSFMSLTRQAPGMVKVMAENVKGAGGSVAKLAQMMNDGTVSTRDLFQSLVKGSDEIKKQFDEVVPSITESFNLVTNAIKKFFGEVASGGAIPQMFNKVMRALADNIDVVIKSLAALAIAVAFLYGVPMAIGAITNAVRVLTAAIAANPIGALIVALTTVISFLVMFRDSIKLGTDDITALGDVMAVIGGQIVDLWNGLVDVVSDVFHGIVDFATDALDQLEQKTASSTDSMASSYKDFYSDVGTGVGGMLKGIAKTVDAIVGLLLGVATAIVRVFSGLPAVFGNIFSRVYNAVVGKIQSMVNAGVDAINKLRGLVGKGLIDHVSLELRDVDKDAMKNYGRNIMGSIDEGFRMEGGTLEKWMDGVFGKAQARAKERAGKAGDGSLGGLGGGGAVGPNAADKQARDQLLQQLNALIGTYNSVYKAQMDLAKAQELLDKGVKAGLITRQKEIEVMERVREKLKDQLDPMGAINRELEKQGQLLKMSNFAQETENQLEQYKQKLQDAGIKLNKTELEQLRAKIVANQELAHIMQVQNQLMQNSAAARAATAKTDITAMKGLLGDKSSGYTKTDAFNEANQQMGGLFNGSNQAMQAQLKGIQEYYDRVNELRAADIIDEDTASQARKTLWAQEQSIKLQAASDMFGALAQLSQSTNSKLAAIGKAAAITQAVINTYEGATKALAQGGIYGSIMAAIVVAQGLAQVAMIRSQQTPGYRTGGEFMVGGGGVSDSQLVAFRATPGEHVAITPPEQARGDSSKDQAVNVPVTVLNVRDPSEVPAAMATAAGKKVFVNTMKEDPDTFKRILGIT